LQLAGKQIHSAMFRGTPAEEGAAAWSKIRPSCRNAIAEPWKAGSGKTPKRIGFSIVARRRI
jgi:hypothetical protein